MKVEINSGPLRFCSRGDEGEAEAVLHTTSRELKSEVKSYPGDKSHGPFKTIDFESEGSRMTIFLTNEQLAAVRLSLQEGEALE